jgi:hypothetical protein
MYAREARWVDEAPLCTVPAPIDTTGWRPAAARAGAYPFTLPPDFVEDTSVFFFHGGTSWTDGRREFDVSWVLFSPQSFREQAARCRTELGGRPVVVVTRRDRGRWHITFWPYNADNAAHGYSTRGPLYSGASRQRGDEPLFWTVVRAAVAAVPEKPVPQP